MPSCFFVKKILFSTVVVFFFCSLSYTFFVPSKPAKIPAWESFFFKANDSEGDIVAAEVMMNPPAAAAPAVLQ